MVKIEFENIVFNNTTQTYQVLNNGTCIYESNNEYEAIIFESKRLLYGENYNSRTYRRKLQKRSFVNGIEIPKLIHYEEIQKRYVLTFDGKYIYSNHNLDEVMKLYNYLQENGIEKTLENKWNVVKRQRAR